MQSAAGSVESKPGGLARAIAPARIVNLILSDVLGNPLSVIASGLSVQADGDDSDRIDSVMRSEAWSALPAPVRDRLSAPAGGAAGSDNVVQNVVVGDASLAAKVAGEAATQLGYRAVIVGTTFAAEAREFGRIWAQIAVSAAHGGTEFSPPCCIVGAGEMTVTVRGGGAGGRNTEMAAAAALEIDGEPNVVVASLATDGDDGSSQAAGGIVNGATVRRLRDARLNPRDLLDRNDTRQFLESSGGLVLTGQTGTNVNDIYLALIGEP